MGIKSNSIESIVKQAIVWAAVGLVGAVVFDGVLELTGVALMAGGIVTFQVAAWLGRRLGREIDASLHTSPVSIHRDVVGL